MPELLHKTTPRLDPAAPGTIRLLVVEDDPLYATVLEGLLASVGVAVGHVEWATALDQVLPALRRGNLDAMLLDLAVPGGDVLAWIRAHTSDAHVPIIALTAVDSEADAVEALAAGAQDFLIKSRLDGEHLIRSVRYALERKRSERALRQRDEQLQQAQTLETVGRLAGGIAHDFSHLLTAVIGASQRLLDAIGPEHPLRGDAAAILAHCEQAAGLTRQLLAFSRKPVTTPQPVDLRELATSISRLVTPLLGERIALRLDAPPDLWRVSAVSVQMEQVLMNLVLNARDAMPAGGALTLRLRNETVGESQGGADGAMPPAGDHVVLDVIDAGLRMGGGASEESVAGPAGPTLTGAHDARVGLVTLRGIVHQAGGRLTEPGLDGRGPSARVYLPRAPWPVAPSPSPRAAAEAMELGGHETVLLAEDEGAVRELVRTVLEAAGYTVLPANGVQAALSLAAGWTGPVHVLVTDLVMPGGTGTGLAQTLIAQRPGLKVLFISGYPEQDGSPGTPVPEVAFLPKPFTRKLLLRALRELLD